jgi:hypothetical protein
MKELALERQLLKKSIYLRELDKTKCTYDKQRKIEREQDEFYRKWKLLSGILKERNNEKINEFNM